MTNIAILIEDEYEDLEYWYPKLRCQEAGFKVSTIHLNSGDVFKSKHGYEAKSDLAIKNADANAFVAVIIPGGWAPDRMRQHKELVEFVRSMHEKNKLVASICHGGSMLVSAGIVKGKNLTSYSAIRDDLIAAGANWQDKDVVRDGNLVTSRTPSDLPAFMHCLLEQVQAVQRKAA